MKKRLTPRATAFLSGASIFVIASPEPKPNREQRRAAERAKRCPKCGQRHPP